MPKKTKIFVSFSGGRTSAVMTKLLLDNYDRKDVKEFPFRGKDIIKRLLISLDKV